MFPTDAEAAKPVQDGCRETSSFAELRVDVERVQVAGETVQRCLFFGGALFHDCVGATLRRLVGLCCGAAVTSLLLTTEVSGAADEDCALVVEDVLSSLRIFGCGAVDDETSLASVGMGNFRISRYCSPWRSILGSKFGTMSSKEKGGSALKGGTTPNVGMTWKFSSPS
jgi:hypothetical protein